MTEKIRIVFDGPPGHLAGRFIEAENEKGESISGKWVHEGIKEERKWYLEFPKLYGLVSYCTTHDTYPAEGDPCWECANPHIIAADLSAARDGFDRGYTKGTKFVDELEARIANLVIDKNETFWRGYAYAIEVVTRLGRENMP